MKAIHLTMRVVLIQQDVQPGKLRISFRSVVWWTEHPRLEMSAERAALLVWTTKKMLQFLYCLRYRVHIMNTGFHLLTLDFILKHLNISHFSSRETLITYHIISITQTAFPCVTWYFAVTAVENLNKETHSYTNFQSLFVIEQVNARYNHHDKVVSGRKQTNAASLLSELHFFLLYWHIHSFITIVLANHFYKAGNYVSSL